MLKRIKDINSPVPKIIRSAGKNKLNIKVPFLEFAGTKKLFI